MTFLLNPYRYGSAVFSPTDISGLDRWYKADALTGLADNDPVSSWTDSSGNARHGTASGGVRPLYKTGIVNSLPVVRFDNVDDTINAGASALPLPLTAFVVFKVDQTGSWSVLGSGGLYLYGDTLGQSTMHISAGMNVGSGITQSTWYIFACRYNGASSKGNRSDSGTTYTGNPGSSPNGITAFGQLLGGGAARWGSDVAEFIFYDTALSGTDIDRVGNYLASKYGLTWTGGAT